MGVYMCGVCNVLECLCVDFQMCSFVCVCVGVFDIFTCIYCVFFVCTVLSVLFLLCIFIFISCLYHCKDYCHRVITTLQQVSK